MKFYKVIEEFSIYVKSNVMSDYDKNYETWDIVSRPEFIHGRYSDFKSALTKTNELGYQMENYKSRNDHYYERQSECIVEFIDSGRIKIIRRVLIHISTFDASSEKRH